MPSLPLLSPSQKKPSSLPLWRAIVWMWLGILPSHVGGWGFLAHKKINEQAVFLLPTELLAFYKRYLTYIREEAVKPDKRRYVVEGEARKHYINLEDYHEKGEIPRYWSEAVARYDDDFRDTYGILPWHLFYMKRQLTHAFKAKDLKKILRLSADLGHYMADACVPLHTTSNYNGQLTGQEGIHALWETRLVELFLDDYDLVFEQKATYITDVPAKMWEVVYQTHAKVLQVLEIERELDAKFPAMQKYVFEQRGQRIQRNYTRDYARRYHKALHGMVEEQLRIAIQMVASLWLTAWMDAGCPDLSKLGGVISYEEIDETAAEEPLFQRIRPHECNG